MLTLVIFPISTTVFAVFLGWLRLRTGSVWPGSVAHASNNGAEDSLHRLAFTGRADGTPALSSTAPSLLAEAIVLLGIVAADHLLRRRRGILAPGDSSTRSGPAAA
jgi:membrane protease YdiL (CAAX protease family)